MQGVAAYKQEHTPDNSVSQALQFWGANQSRKNAAKKLADERQGVRDQQVEKKKHQDFLAGFSEDELAFEMTGNKSFNDVMTKYTTSTSAKAADIMRRSRELETTNPAEARRLQQQYNQIKTSYKTIAFLSKPVQEKVKWNMEHAGELNPNDNRFKFTDAIAKNNFMMTIDDNGKPKMIVGLDKDGNGEISAEEKEAGDKYLRDGFKTEGFEFQEIDPNDFAQGAYDQYKKVDIQGKGGLLDQITSGVALTTQDSISGDFITTKEFLSTSDEESLKKSIHTAMQDPETRAWVMNTIVGVRDKVDGFAEKGENSVETAEQKLFELAKGKYKFKSEIKQRGLTRTDLLNRDKKRQELDNKKFDLAKWKAENTKKGDTKEEKVEKIYSKIYEIANELKTAGRSDEEALKVAEKYGLDAEAIKWFDWGRNNDYELGGKNIDEKDTSIMEIGKNVAKQFDIPFDGQMWLKIVGNQNNDVSSQKKDTSKMTPQEKIEYYKSLKTK